MAIIYGNEIAKMKVVFTNNEGKSVSQTFNNLKPDAVPQDILFVATKISTVTDMGFNHVSKIAETEIVNA